MYSQLEFILQASGLMIQAGRLRASCVHVASIQQKPRKSGSTVRFCRARAHWDHSAIPAQRTSSTRQSRAGVELALPQGDGAEPVLRHGCPLPVRVSLPRLGTRPGILRSCLCPRFKLHGLQSRCARGRCRQGHLPRSPSRRFRPYASSPFSIYKCILTMYIPVDVVCVYVYIPLYLLYIYIHACLWLPVSLSLSLSPCLNG